MKHLIFITLIAPLCNSISDWRPVLQPDLYPGLKGRLPSEPSFSSLTSLVQSYQSSATHAGGQCELYKVGFLQDLYFQYIQYKTDLPGLKEFTLCYWSKFSNHTNDHPVFSYAVDGQPRALLSWVSNTERSSYFSMAVSGHTFYRLNYPLRLNRWYHTCQSWNGRTGEWQIWVNAERVGRGFHNRLVGHVIPSGGIAITGQEQTQYGGGFLEGDEAPKGAGGMLGEITMVQLYSVALTAGKAHRDHKHHHAHEFDHNGQPITTTPPPSRPPRPLTPTHPLLTGGQLNPNVALTIASGNTQQLPPQTVSGQTFDAQLLNGQFVNSLVSQQLMNAPQSRGPQQFLQQNAQPGQQLPQQLQIGMPVQSLQQARLSQAQQISAVPQPSVQAQFLPRLSIESPIQQQISAIPQPPLNQQLLPGPPIGQSLLNPANVQFIDTQLETHQLFKRDNTNKTTSTKSDIFIKNEYDNTDKEGKLESKIKTASVGIKSSSKNSSDKKQSKRELILQGDSIINTEAISASYDQTLLNGLAGIGDNQPILKIQKQYDEREPAEAEVKAVMNVCSGCDEEPFEKALVFGWRTVTKKLYSGAFYMPALPRCKAF